MKHHVPVDQKGFACSSRLVVWLQEQRAAARLNTYGKHNKVQHKLLPLVNTNHQVHTLVTSATIKALVCQLPWAGAHCP
jgi:hypothetical protein